MTLKLQERETIITYDEASKTANIYTCSPALMRKLEKLASECDDVVLENKTDFSVSYYLPKKLISVRRLPNRSEEAKLAGISALNAYRADQNKQKEG